MRKPLVPSLHCSSLSRSRSKASEPFEPFTSQLNAFLRPGANRLASIVPTAPALELDHRLEGVVDLTAGLERPDRRGHRLELADEVAGEVDHVRAEVAERARAGLLAHEAPGLGVGHAPLLQVAAAEVADLAQLARLDQLAREPDRGDEAVVEGGHVLDAGRGDAPPDLVALVGGATERLLADHVLARLGGGDRRLGVEVVRAAVVEELDLRVGDELAPVGDVTLEAEASPPPRRPPPRSRPAIETSRGWIAGGPVMYASVR